MYCGVDVVVRQAIQLVSGNSRNFLELAKAASAAGNSAEAYDYYTKVLEIEPANADAWFGKGTTAGWQSNLNKFRFPEMLSAYEKAVKYTPSEAVPALKTACAKELKSLAVRCFNMAGDHQRKFSNASITLSMVDRQKEAISLLEKAHEFDPSNTNILENLINVVPEDSRTAYLAKLQVLNPNYVPPKKEESGCFVVTATMGDVNHPTVTILRSFRDEFLIKSTVGTAFVNWYYKYGPAIARRIEASTAARLISYLLIVAPAAGFASIILWLPRKSRQTWR